MDIKTSICIAILTWAMIGSLVVAMSHHVQAMNYRLSQVMPEKQVMYISATMLFWPASYFIYRHFKKKINFVFPVIKSLSTNKDLCQQLLDEQKRALLK